jgi:uncharacterized protein
MMNEKRETVDRPWPKPDGPWLMAQVWHDLLFAHWPVSVEQMRALVPDAFPLDTFDGRAWIGVVPFHMSGVRFRRLPALPWIGAFPELNVRTYVIRDGKPGVYFFSLDAANPLAVWAARRFFHLPYFRARMEVEHRNGEIRYRSARTHRGEYPAEFAARYQSSGDRIATIRGSIDEWLTERYCLYTTDGRGRPLRQEIDHAVWSLQPAEAEIERNTMTVALGIDTSRSAPLLHVSQRLEVIVWPAERLPATGTGI